MKVKQENLNSNQTQDSLVDSIKILTELTQRDMENSYITDNVNGTKISQYDYE